MGLPLYFVIDVFGAAGFGVCLTVVLACFGSRYLYGGIVLMAIAAKETALSFLFSVTFERSSPNPVS